VKNSQISVSTKNTTFTNQPNNQPTTLYQPTNQPLTPKPPLSTKTTTLPKTQRPPTNQPTNQPTNKRTTAHHQLHLEERIVFMMFWIDPITAAF
jgi:hypothetical protein